MNITKMPPIEFINSCFEYKDGELVWKYRAFAPKHINTRFAGKPAGNYCPNGYKYVRVKYQGKVCSLLAHRVIYYMHNPSFDQSYYIDHIDYSRNNNRIENLRAVLNSENMKNRNATKSSKSGYKNIFKIGKKLKPWVVQISIQQYKRFHVGSFATLKEALEARDFFQQEAGYVR